MATIFNSSFGGGTISLSEFVNAKEGLRKTPATVVTQIDGKRFVESYDGTRTEISALSADEDGKWAVMDDNAALGLAEEESKSATTSSPDLSSINHNLGDVPSLGPYLRLLQVGVPLEVVKSKVVADENSGGLPKGTLERFQAGVDKATEGSGGQSSESEKAAVYMEGTHAEKHGWLGDPCWEAPHLAVNCDVEARAGYNSAKSHEFLDSPEVLREKVKLLALLFRKAKRPVVYAGAGLSTASGIGDYATQTGQSGVLAQRKKQAEQAEREEASAAVRGGGSAGEASASGRNPSSAKKTSGVSSSGKQIFSAMMGTSPFCAKPNLGHQSLAALARHGYVWRFIQQNHDGLPQKAGMPQHLVNEIHGGWFDPSNPVVAMSGALRTDLFDDLLLCEKQTDLVLAVGTSLCGMNADRLVKTAAGKARREREDRKAVSEATVGKVAKEQPRRSLSSLLSFTDHRKSAGQPTAAAAAAAAAAAGSTLSAAELPNQVAFGSVIVSLQQTVHDHNCSLRIFGLIDDVLSLLAEELLRGDGENLPPPTSEQKPEAEREEEDVFYVPYHETSGKRALQGGGGGGRLTKLDLREGAELTVSHGPDAGSNAVVTGKNLDGHWRLSVERRLKSGRAFQETRLLGKWWPFEAEQGLVPYIPVVPRAADA